MAPQAPTDLTSSIPDERIRPFLPLVYLAWSDGELTPEEIEAPTSAVAAIEDDPIRVVLDRLLALHVLATIRADLAWFQEHGRLSASTALAAPMTDC